MTKLFFVSLVASSALAGSNAYSADVSPAGADQLTRAFERYVGRTADGKPGLVTVTLEGDAYQVRFNFQPLLDRLSDVGVTVEMLPYKMTMAPLEDGTWKVAASDELKIAFVVKDQSGHVTAEGMAFNGIFDPALATFRTSTTSIASITSEQENLGSRAKVVSKDTVQTTTASPGRDGTADVSIKSTNGLFSEVVHAAPPPAGKPPTQAGMDLEIRSSGRATTGDILGLRAVPTLDLWAFLVANPTRQQLTAGQDDLKSRIKAGWPPMDGVKLQTAFHALSIQTPFGKGTAGELATAFDMSTLSPSSSVRFGVKVTDLAVDSVFVPDFAKPLIPTRLDLNFAAQDFDLTTSGKLLVDLMDLSKADVFEATRGNQALKTAFLPKAMIHVDIPPSAITSPAYTIAWRGSLDLNDKGQSKVHIDVRAAGIDDLINALQRVKDGTAAQVVIGLYGAKALAKPGDNGTLTWAVDMTEAGDLTVNGSPIGPKRL